MIFSSLWKQKSLVVSIVVSTALASACSPERVSGPPANLTSQLKPKNDLWRSCSYLYYGTPDQVLLSCTEWNDSPIFIPPPPASGGGTIADHTTCEGPGCMQFPMFDGGGSGGGGTGSTPLPPPVVLDLEDVTGAPSDTTLPNCSSGTNLSLIQQRWCEGAPPDPLQTQRIKDAAGRLTSRGAICAEKKLLIDWLLARGRLRLFAPGPGKGSGGASGAGDGYNGWLVITSGFTDYAWDADHKDSAGRTLLSALVHETDHLEGEEGHTGGKGPAGNDLTANQTLCGL